MKITDKTGLIKFMEFMRGLLGGEGMPFHYLRSILEIHVKANFFLFKIKLLKICILLNDFEFPFLETAMRDLIKSLSRFYQCNAILILLLQ